MAYSTDNPPVCLVNGLASAINIWHYASTDGATDVDADGYISDGQDLGMGVGDIVYVEDTNASPVTVTVHRVVSVSSTDRSVDLSNGDTLITGTDSD